MSKKGRTSVLLLGSLVFCLICIPLAFLAYGAKLDRTTLNKRIALLESTAVASPTALQTRYRAARERLLPILPPDPDYTLDPSGGLVVFDPADFSWAATLEPSELNGVTVYPVTVSEDPETRYTIFYNVSVEAIGYLAPEQDYIPFAWLADRHPEYYAETADPDALAWAEAVYDPARVSVTYYLLPADDVEAMAEAQLAAVQQPAFQMDMMMGEGLPEPVTNLVIFAIEKVTNGVALGIGWPDDFTNKLEVFARYRLAASGWAVASSNLSTTGTNSLWWTDTALATSDVARFYSVGNADLDSDGDGVADARERKVTGTDENATDSDYDGLVDGYSGKVTTNSYPGGARTNGGVYVEGEMTWGTDLLLVDTDGDGMGDGWEVANGHDPLDPNDPPNVSGTVSYAGGQTGIIRVVAVTDSGSWATNDSVSMAAPGLYLLPNLNATSYWLKAWRDADGDGAVDTSEAWGAVSTEPVTVTNKLTGQDVTLSDPDDDSDGLPDWWELARFGSTTNWIGADDPDSDQYTNLEEYEAGTEPLNSLSHPWNISGTISYAGPQTGAIYVAACTAATEWAAVQYTYLATTGSYMFTHLPPDRDYWIRAWRDSNSDETPDFWEAWGNSQNNPAYLNTNVTAMDVTLLDADSDSDGLPDWWEVLYGFDPYTVGGATASAWWKLNATAGTNVQDSTSHANNGILVNVGANGWTSGVISNALSFDGVDDYVQIPDSEILKPTYASVSLWVKPSHDYTNGTAVFFSKKQPGGSSGYQLSYEQGKLTFSVCVSGERVVSRPLNLSSGVWHHVVGTYGGAHQRLYVDGALAAQADYSWGPSFGFIDQGASVARIAASAGSSADGFFAGVIDDVRVYAGELAANQVRGLYGQGSDEDDDGLSAWQEYQLGTDPVKLDTDEDDLADGEEWLIHGTRPLWYDSDGDELPDGWEILYGLDPLNAEDGWIDTDGDGWGNDLEYYYGTNPRSKDTDDDGFEDAQDGNPCSRAIIQWGNPQFTLGNAYRGAGPVWWKGAYKINGEFVGTPPYGWSAEGGALTSRQDMVGIPAGTNAGVEPDDGPYSITVRAFNMEQTEVTKALWDTVRCWGLTNGYFDLPAGGGKLANHPVQMVSWYDCLKWCNARSEMEGLTPAYYTSSTHKRVYRSGSLDLQWAHINEGSGGYRLPTGGEWEYAGRGGVTGTRFPWGDTITYAQANYYSFPWCSYDVNETHGFHPDYSTNGLPYTSPVGSFDAHGYGAGLYDMIGNVAEWTWSQSPRGGAWSTHGEYCKLNDDPGGDPSTQSSGRGFRTVISQASCLVIQVDRQLLTNTALLEMTYLDAAGADLRIELADAGNSPVVLDLCGNLVTGSGQITNRQIEIPFAAYPAASQIRIVSAASSATVYTNRLYVDQDQDGLDADQEAQLGTLDNDGDSDNDGLSDWLEVKVLHTMPTSWDSNTNNISDYDEDFDNDGLPNGVEVNGLAGVKSPFMQDTDGDSISDYDEDFDQDGLSDGDEVMMHETRYDSRDTDLDYLDDGNEVARGTDPLDPDSDGDGLTDGAEVCGYDAWAISASTNIAWASPGTNFNWITQWTTGVVVNGRIRGGLSAPIEAVIQIGAQSNDAIRLSSDGFVLLGNGEPSEQLAYGVNLPVTWPGLSNLIAACWDEYTLATSTGLWYEVTGTGLAQKITVTWSGAKTVYAGEQAEGLDFQMQYTSSNRAFAYLYKASSGLAFPTHALATVGIRGSSTNSPARYLFNRLGVLAPGMAVTITPVPSDPLDQDTDEDEYTDGEEASRGWNPAAAENLEHDADGDGLVFSYEVALGSDPLELDSDGDGITDGEEELFGLDPAVYDLLSNYDNDGLENYLEWIFGTNPGADDTDGDDVNDDVEVWQGSNPCDQTDAGIAPASVILFMPTLGSGSPLGTGGSVLAVDDYRLDANLCSLLEYYNVGLPLRAGEDHVVSIYTKQGVVQCPTVETAASVNGLPGEWVPANDLRVYGNVVAHHPSLALGSLGLVRPEAESDRKGFFLQNQQPMAPTNPVSTSNMTLRVYTINVTPEQRNWCWGSEVQLVASIAPTVAGEWSWTQTGTDNFTNNSNTATFTLRGAATVTPKYSFGAGSTPYSTNVGFQVHNNGVTFELQPYIGVNDNDSDNNGTNDCSQATPPANDPDIVTATVTYHKACDCTINDDLVATVTCDSGGDKIRTWASTGMVVGLPDHASLGGGSSVTFKVEGITTSDAVNDVAFTAKVEYRDHSSVYSSNSAATTVLKVELDGDTDRDGDIDDSDEIEEETNTVTRGILVTPPLRALTANGNDVTGLPTLKINSQPTGPISGLTLKLTKTYEATGCTLQFLKINGEKFPDIGAGQSYSFAEWPTNTITLVVMPQYARPLTTNTWPIRFDLELRAVDASSNIVCIDAVRLRVAPIILPPECNAEQNIYTRAPELAGIPGVTYITNDTFYPWAQDMVKFVKHQIASVQTEELFVDLDHVGKGNFPDKLRSEKDWDGGMVWEDSMGGDGGSIMATPPFGTYNFGAIMIGDQQGATYQTKWKGQGVQPVIEIHTSWLAVGHVDEILMWVDSDKVLYADPRKAADLLHQDIAAGNYTNRLWFGFDDAGTNKTIQEVVIATTGSGYKLTNLLNLGLSNSASSATLVFSNTIFAVDDILRVDDEIFKVTTANGPTVTVARAQAGTPPAAHAPWSVIYAYSDVLKANLPVGPNPDISVVGRISAATNQLRQALGSYAANFIPMPVLFGIPSGLNKYVAGSSDVVNCLVGSGGTIYYPQTGCASFENYIGTVLPGAQPVNAWSLHIGSGEIHCATAAQRQLNLTPPWWQQIDNWE